MVKMLSVEEVMQIHHCLVRDFEETNDPISPPGLRDEGLLDSAVNRQHIGAGDSLKYFDEYLSAATLTYGLCMNHCFHNGNKRTALVSMFVHLDKNGIRLQGVTEKTLYDLFVNFADHSIHLIDEVRKWATADFEKYFEYRKTLKLPPKIGSTLKHPGRLEDSDLEVYCLTAWLRRNTTQVRNYDREVTLRELRKLLAKFDVRIEQGSGISFDVLKKEIIYKRDGWIFGKKIETERWNKVYTFHCGGENRPVNINTIKKIRQACGLSNAHGIDALQFYGDEPAVDYFLASYSKLLRRLSRT